MREVDTELVRWKMPAIEYASFKLISYYTQALKKFGTEDWLKFGLQELLQMFRGEKFPATRFEGEGFSLVFQAPPEHILEQEDGKLIWVAKEPRILFYDSSFGQLNPSRRNQLFKTNQAIAYEMHTVYHLDVIGGEPQILLFPKNEYAESIERRKAVLLEF